MKTVDMNNSFKKRAKAYVGEERVHRGAEALDSNRRRRREDARVRPILWICWPPIDTGHFHELTAPPFLNFLWVSHWIKRRKKKEELVFAAHPVPKKIVDFD